MIISKYIPTKTVKQRAIVLHQHQKHQNRKWFSWMRLRYITCGSTTKHCSLKLFPWKPGWTRQTFEICLSSKIFDRLPTSKTLVVQHFKRVSSKKCFRTFSKHHATNFGYFCLSSNVWSFGCLSNISCQTFPLFFFWQTSTTLQWHLATFLSNK